jgi:hypothetical protein
VGRRSGARLGGDRYAFVRCDVGDVAGMEAVLATPFATVASTDPAVACLVNNAAVAEPIGVVGTLTPADILRALTVNLAAPMALANLFCRTVAAKRGDRRIVNVSSGAAVRPLTGSGHYSIAKAGPRDADGGDRRGAGRGRHSGRVAAARDHRHRHAGADALTARRQAADGADVPGFSRAGTARGARRRRGDHRRPACWKRRWSRAGRTRTPSSARLA